VLRVAAQAGDGLARAGAVELPAVVVTLNIPVDDESFGQWRVPVGAAIEQRDTLSIGVSKCNEW
jgi:hypothetical protein